MSLQGCFDFGVEDGTANIDVGSKSLVLFGRAWSFSRGDVEASQRVLQCHFDAVTVKSFLAEGWPGFGFV